MGEIIKTSLLGLFFGTFGTILGGLIGINLRGTSKKALSFILSLASGLMLAIVSFELVPEATNTSGICVTIIGILLGIITMIFCDVKVKSYFEKRKGITNSLLRTGIIVSIGLALHNIPEGLAIGTGFEASIKLGYSLAIAIAIHDIPEGISMAAPMKNGGMKAGKILIYVFLSGITTGVGALIGAIIGNISEKVIAICLSFAAGAMIYIVSGELTPESSRLYNGRMSSIGNMLGFILGYIATQI